MEGARRRIEVKNQSETQISLRKNEVTAVTIRRHRHRIRTIRGRRVGGWFFFFVEHRCGAYLHTIIMNVIGRITVYIIQFCGTRRYGGIIFYKVIVFEFHVCTL